MACRICLSRIQCYHLPLSQICSRYNGVSVVRRPGERYCRLLPLLGQDRSIGTGCRMPKIPVPSKYFVSTPIYYLNAAPHLGHLYTNVLADVISRWYQMLGSKIVFSTGSDEHGLKVQQAAAASNKDPQTFCDQLSTQFKKLFLLSDINFTDFIRTTEPRHVTAVHSLWNRISERGYMYKGAYEGWYCVSDEAFLTPEQVTEATDSNTGQTYKVSRESGHVVEWMKEENYVFRLSHLTRQLTDWLDTNVITPVNFEPIVRQMISEGLRDLSVSRPAARIPWGIPVPGDSTQTIYVWLDALTNYLTVAGYPNTQQQQQQECVWPADCHVVGKDIVKFHAIYWPAFLLAAGLEPPRQILCHSHWLVNKEKMSKSRGNVIDPFDRLQRYSSDCLRYYLIKDGVPHSDANYSDDRVIEVMNCDLVNTLCNLVSRCTSESLNRDQIFPALNVDVFKQLATDTEIDLLTSLYQLPDVADEFYRSFTPHRALEASLSCLYRANSFIQTHKPWLLAKSTDTTDKLKLRCVIHVGLETARVATLVLSPVIPRLADRILTRLGVHGPTQVVAGLRSGKESGQGSPIGSGGSTGQGSGGVFPLMTHCVTNTDCPLGVDVGVLLQRFKTNN